MCCLCFAYVLCCAVLCCSVGWLRSSDYRSRRITAILYINDEDWDCSPLVDGGALRCYIDNNSTVVIDSDPAVAGVSAGASAGSVLNINPAGGTLVLFDSRYLLHEVCPSNRERFALTIWISGE